jgi:hypothetical protein
MAKAHEKADTPARRGMPNLAPYYGSIRTGRKISWLVIAVFVVIALFAWLLTRTPSFDKKTEAAVQNTLQKSLSAALSKDDEQTILSATSQLINGANSGQFVISKTTLAQYHLDKANALFNLGLFGKAVPEYSAARQSDNSLTLISLKGEVQSEFALGERKQLIPLLQQIVQMSQQQEKMGQDINGSGSQLIAEYSSDITALQNNQTVEQL